LAHQRRIGNIAVADVITAVGDGAEPAGVVIAVGGEGRVLGADAESGAAQKGIVSIGDSLAFNP
jgi:hypothetical protein